MSSPSAFSIHKLSSRNLLQLLPYFLPSVFRPSFYTARLIATIHTAFIVELPLCSLLTRSRLPLKRRLISLLSSILHRRHWRRLLSERESERAELVAHILSSPSLSFVSPVLLVVVCCRHDYRKGTRERKRGRHSSSPPSTLVMLWSERARSDGQMKRPPAFG